MHKKFNTFRSRFKRAFCKEKYWRKKHHSAARMDMYNKII